MRDSAVSTDQGGGQSHHKAKFTKVFDRRKRFIPSVVLRSAEPSSFAWRSNSLNLKAVRALVVGLWIPGELLVGEIGKA